MRRLGTHTGEPKFAVHKKAFGDRCLFSGLGDSIHLTATHTNFRKD